MRPNYRIGFWSRARQSFSLLTAGGDWALSFPPGVRRNLHWFWFDGLFAVASDNIVITYLTLYVLAMGASKAQIGLLNSLTNLSAALVLLPGALLVETIGRRKQIALLSGGWISRLVLLVLALLPLAMGGEVLIYMAIALSVVRNAFANLGFPAWMSLTADIVPLEGRGRYFGSRNFVANIVGMITILLVGEMITRSGQPLGYQLATGMAFVLGMASTFYFSHLTDPYPEPVPRSQLPMAPTPLLRDLRGHSAFLAFSATAALWNFSLNVAGPYFSVYLVQNLMASATTVAVLTTVTSLASLAVQRRLGVLADHWGPRRMQLLSSLAIWLLPIAWIFARSAWHVVPINIASGIFWGAFNLASFNMLLAVTPEEQRARYSALYQIIVTVALSAGAAVGGVIVTQWGYPAIFLCSGLGRLAAALLFARFVKTPKPGSVV